MVAGMTGLVELEIPLKADYVVVTRLVSGELARRAGFSPESVEDIKLAVSESCVAILHKHPDETDRMIDIAFDFPDDAISVEVSLRGSDQARPAFDRSDDEEEALRLSLIESLADDVGFFGASRLEAVSLNMRSRESD